MTDFLYPILFPTSADKVEEYKIFLVSYLLLPYYVMVRHETITRRI